jgi:hypothetical protein
MINTFNPEYTRQALQTKYGDPNSFTYKQPKPMYLNWDFTNSATNADYQFISNPGNRYTFFVGTLTLFCSVAVANSARWRITTPENFAQTITNINTASGTSIASYVAPFQMPVVMSTFAFATTPNTLQMLFSFYGFYYEQP